MSNPLHKRIANTSRDIRDANRCKSEIISGIRMASGSDGYREYVSQKHYGYSKSEWLSKSNGFVEQRQKRLHSDLNSLVSKGSGPQLNIVLSVLIVMIGVYYIFSPQIIGFVTLGGETVILDSFFDVNSTLELDMDTLESFNVFGFVSKVFSGSVYLVSDSGRYNLLDYYVPELSRIVANSSLDVSLTYESISGLAGGLSVSSDVDSSAMCTHYVIESLDDSSSTNICYGGGECCGFLGLPSSYEYWNSTLYVNPGKFGMTSRNTIKAQVYYFNVSLDPLDSYSDIRYSDIEGILADFFDDKLDFGTCGETCSISSTGLHWLEIEVISGSIFIANYSYTEPTGPNHAPVFSSVPNVTFASGSNYSLDLSQYVTDVNGDELYFDYFGTDGVVIEFEGMNALISASSGFTGSVFTFFIANDSKLFSMSDIFEINVVEGNVSVENVSINEFLPVTQVEIDKPVTWRKEISVNESLDNLTINVSGYGFNISVKKKENDRFTPVSVESVSIVEDGTIESLAEYNNGKLRKRVNYLLNQKLVQKKRNPNDIALLNELKSLLEERSSYLGSDLEGASGKERREVLRKIKLTEQSVSRIDKRILRVSKLEGVEAVNTTADEELVENVSFASETKVVIEDLSASMEISYVTDGPTKDEEEISPRKKRVVVSSDVHYTNVRAYSDIKDSPESAIKLYSVDGDTRNLVKDVIYEDRDNDSLIDRIYWTVPGLSSQTYEIILITKAEHLDSNRSFISDIYDYVKEQDGNWSPAIDSGEYIRVTFEKNLTSSNDITVYARNNQSLNTSIEVYEYNQSELIIEFPVIVNESYYKIYLTNMSSASQDVFDLRIVNLDNISTAYLEFDHIIDPTEGESRVNRSNAFVLYDVDGTRADNFGNAVTTGDFNNDNFDDALVGAWYADGGAGSTGKAYIYFGDASGKFLSRPGPDVILLDPDDVVSDNFGKAVGAGDFNNDGYDDALVGAWYADGGAGSTGKAYIYFGAASNMANGTNASVTLEDPDDVANDNFGVSVTAGDFNNDGYVDALVGAHLADGGNSQTGKAYIYFGAASNMANGTNASVTLEDPDDVLNDYFGFSVTAGDFNNDNFDDALVAAPIADGGNPDTGKAYIYFGAASNMANGTNASVTLEDPDDVASDYFGFSVTAGDFNNDGYDDALVGAHLADGGNSATGKAYIYFGAASNMANGTNASVTLEAPDDTMTDNFGYSVTAGDFNNDNFDDALVGAWKADGGNSNTGKAYIYFGAASNMANGTNANVTLLDPDDVASDNFGKAVGAGDFNNDNFDDALVGAWYADSGPSTTGKAYVYFFGNSFYDYSAKLLDNGTTSTTLEVYTYLNSTCKYSNTSKAFFSDMTALSTTDGLNHTLSVSGLEDGNVSTYFVRCNNTIYDYLGSEMVIDFGVGETENNYKVNNSVQWACEKTGTSAKPTSANDCTSYATVVDYQKINSTDAVRWSTSGTDTDKLIESQIFTFNISNSSTRVKFYWEGYGYTTDQTAGYGTDISVWNFNKGIWETKNSKTFSSASDDVLTMELTDLTDYLNASGQIAFLASHMHYTEVATCFPAGTKILMGNGENKNIEDVRVGDFVVSYDEITGKNVLGEVLELEAPVREHMCEISFDDNSTLKLTNEHPIYTTDLNGDKEWKSINPEATANENAALIVSELEEGDHVVTINDSKSVTDIVCWPDEVQTYNLFSLPSSCCL